MLNQRLAVAQKVAGELFPAEEDLDSAIVHAARLTIAVIEGRQTAKLPVTVGQEGLALVSRATAKLVDARGDIGAAHIAFRETQEEIGLRAVAFGDVHECPPKTAEMADHEAKVSYLR
jgi:hypothetical protein